MQESEKGITEAITEDKLKGLATTRKLLHHLLSAIILADQQTLKKLEYETFRGRCIQARSAQIPPRPLEDKKILYGYYLALHQLASLAEHSVIPYEELKSVLDDKVACQILFMLSEQPMGVLEKSGVIADLMTNLDLTEQEGIKSTLDNLQQGNMIRQEKRGNDDLFIEILVLTAKGNRINEMLKHFSFGQP